LNQICPDLGIPIDSIRSESALDGDALDRDTIERALVGVDAVIQTLGVPSAPEQIFSGTRLFSAATRILVDAMEASAVRRLICVTGLGAGDSRGRGGPLYNVGLCLFLGRIYADKDVQERIIRRSQLDWTIVRPTILTNGPRTGTYRVQTDPRNWTSGFISRVDVADFLVTQTPALTGSHKSVGHRSRVARSRSAALRRDLGRP
jgi:putative NADH-flavin reductase